MAKLFSIALLLVGLGAPQQSQVPIRRESNDPLLAQHDWVQVVSHDLRWERGDFGQRDYNLQKTAIGFRVSRDIQGTALLEVVDRPAVALFIGWSVPNSVINDAPNDLRVIFTTVEGTEYVTKFGSGGGHGLMFFSPDGVPVTTLTKVALYRDADAEWAKEQ